MDSEASERTVLVSHSDAMRRSVLLRVAGEEGLRDVGAVDTLPALVTMAGLVHPAVVLADRKTPGIITVEDVVELTRAVAPAVVVMVTDEPSSADRLLAAGVVAVAPEGDLEALRAALARGLVGLDAERGHGAGRRTGEDRRKIQDWSKVTSERRQGDRRTDADRRDTERGDTPPDGSE